MTPKKQVEFIERVSNSPLGLEGMKIVVMCDKCRSRQYPNDIIFDRLGNACMKEVNGEVVMKKYHISPGEQLKHKIHEERIRWIKDR